MEQTKKLPEVGRTINFSLMIYDWYKFFEREKRNKIDSLTTFETKCLDSLLRYINENAFVNFRVAEDSTEFKGLKDISIIALFPEGVYNVQYQTEEGKWVRNINIYPYFYDIKCKFSLDDAIKKMIPQTFKS